MSSYATFEDVAARTSRTFTEGEQTVVENLLEDAAVLIDAYNKKAGNDAKKVVSCRMVLRAMGSGDDGGIGVPIGATQGSMAAGGYSQSWTISGGGTGELYLGRTEKQLLGLGNRIGARSPLENMAAPCPFWAGCQDPSTPQSSAQDDSEGSSSSPDDSEGSGGG